MSHTSDILADAMKHRMIRDFVIRAEEWYRVAENEGQLQTGDETVMKKFLRAMYARERRAERGEGRYRVYCPDNQEEREIEDGGWGPGNAASDVVQAWHREEWFLEEGQPIRVEVSDAATGKPCGSFRIKYHMEPTWECEEVKP